MNKFAIILQAGPGTHESHARMFHSMVYSKELHEAGHDVRLIFDGAATEWLAKWGDPQDADEPVAGPLHLRAAVRRQGIPQQPMVRLEHSLCRLVADALEQLRRVDEVAEQDRRRGRVCGRHGTPIDTPK